jgi:hypothetical protein
MSDQKMARGKAKVARKERKAKRRLARRAVATVHLTTNATA